jgi:prepilin-type N-terminal cleavage/methylation domain-containing protein
MSRPSYVKLAPRHSPTFRAFTLVEILVVIAIIAILASIALVVGGRVTKGGEKSLTESTLHMLDTTLAAYLAEREAKFPSYYIDPQNNVFAIADARGETAAIDAPAQPTIALYLLLAADAPSVQETLKGIDPKLIVRKPVQDVDGRFVRDKDNNPVEGLYINDAWGNPIRFVMPRYHGGHGLFADATGNVQSGRPTLEVKMAALSFDQKFRRSYRPFPSSQLGKGVGDADEGMCNGGRPYFYSAGPDGDPGTRDDNVYSVVPQFPLETRGLQ